MNTLLKYLNDFTELFFPRICIVCKTPLLRQEELVCLSCLHGIPRTNFHFDEKNSVAEIFYGRVRIEYATAFFYFNKGSKYRKLIHALKYKGMKELGVLLGKQFAFDLCQSPLFADIDVVCPVPLHPKKEKKRGYNQSEFIAKGISEQMGKDLSLNNLIRVVYSETQTRKGRYERWENVEGIFDLTNAAKFNGRHILLVDDVLTTGSTLEACASAILKSAEDVTVSIATLGIA